MKIRFLPLAASHMSLILNWLKQPHVKEFWTESENEDEVKAKFLEKLPQRGIDAYIIEVNECPIGFIQAYEACQIGGGWWPDVKPGVFGIDQFIGEPSMIGKGIGTATVGAFVQKLIAEKNAKEIIADPDPANSRAIRLYKRLGFLSHGIIATPNGKAELMQLSGKSSGKT